MGPSGAKPWMFIPTSHRALFRALLDMPGVAPSEWAGSAVTSSLYLETSHELRVTFDTFIDVTIPEMGSLNYPGDSEFFVSHGKWTH